MAKTMLQRVLWNAVLVGAATVVIAGSSVVFAQQMQGEVRREQPPAISQQEDTWIPDGRFAARVASLKEILRLTPEQEKHWSAYEAALQALAKDRRERMDARQQQSGPTDPMQRLRRRAETLGSIGAALSRLVDAQDPLYNSLDEAQKRRFAEFPQMLGEYSDMPRPSRNRDDDGRRGSRGRDDDSDRRWRDRDYNRRGWHGRYHDDDRHSRSRDDDDDRRGWHGRSDDCDRRGWRGRDDDDDDDRRGWRGRSDTDRRGRRGQNNDHNRRGRSAD